MEEKIIEEKPNKVNEDLIKTDEGLNNNEEELNNSEIRKESEVLQIDELSGSSKQKIIIFIIFVIIILIMIIILIVVFSLKKIKEKEDIEILTPLIFNSTSGQHTHTIIFMPGYTNTPEDFKDIFENKINFDKKVNTTMIILRSPLVEVSLTKSKNYSWFDIYEAPIDDYSDVNEDDLKKSAKVLEQVINNEVNILNGDYEKIIVGGHDQGASISLYQAYTMDKKLGGVFAFNGFLPQGDISDDKRYMQTIMGFGDEDDFILPKFMNQSIEKIYDFQNFKLMNYENHKHEFSDEEITSTCTFLNEIIN